MNKHREVIFFLPDVRGGVESVISNVIKFVPRGVSVKIVAYTNVCEERQRISDFPAEVTMKRFSFSAKDNLFFVSDSLQRFVGNAEVIVATDYVELNMIQAQKIDKRVIFIVLGDFDHYYGIALKNENVIDAFITISNAIFTRLCDKLPHRKPDIHSLYFPTPAVGEVHKFENKILKVIFVARLEPSKNAIMLPLIDDILVHAGVKVQWTIVGDGIQRSDLEEKLVHRNNFDFVGFISNQELSVKYREHDIFIMTSFSEGLPVSLIEAMKTGLLPIVSDIDGGIREIVKNGENGFLCHPGAAQEYAEHMKLVDGDRMRLQFMAQQARLIAENNFGSENCTQNYWNVILEDKKRTDKYFKLKGSFLDRRFIPNFLVRFFRSLR